MAEDCTERVVGRNAAVGPNFQDQPVIIRALADARVLDGVTHPRHRRKKRINGNDADGLVGLLVFVAGAETAADLDFQFHLEFFLLVERADVLFGIDQFHILVQLDVAGGNFAFFVRGEKESLRVAAVGLEKNLLEVQHQIGDILDDSVHGGKFVLRAIHFDGSDGRALEGGEQNAAERIADGVTVTGFKGLGEKLRVRIRGGGVLAGQPFRHFKTT